MEPVRTTLNPPEGTPRPLRREVQAPTSVHERFVVAVAVASLSLMLASVSTAVLLRGRPRHEAPAVMALPPEATRPLPTATQVAPRRPAAPPPVTDYADDLSSCWGG
jgi:hypothetical protein